jgi:hypothetical protein
MVNIKVILISQEIGEALLDSNNKDLSFIENIRIGDSFQINGNKYKVEDKTFSLEVISPIDLSEPIFTTKIILRVKK